MDEPGTEARGLVRTLPPELHDAILEYIDQPDHDGHYDPSDGLAADAR
jgi:hypothetical protein